MSVNKVVKRVTTHVLQAMKAKGEKISMLTGYDYSMARIIDEAGVGSCGVLVRAGIGICHEHSPLRFDIARRSLIIV